MDNWSKLLKTWFTKSWIFNILKFNVIYWIYLTKTVRFWHTKVLNRVITLLTSCLKVIIIEVSKVVYPVIKLGLEKAVYPAIKLGLKKAVYPAFKLGTKKGDYVFITCPYLFYILRGFINLHFHYKTWQFMEMGL